VGGDGLGAVGGAGLGAVAGGGLCAASIFVKTGLGNVGGLDVAASDTAVFLSTNCLDDDDC